MSRLCLYSCRITNVYDILFVTCSVVRLFITWEIKLTFVDQRGNYLFFLFENRKYRSQFIPPPSISLFLSSGVLLNLLDSQLLCFATPQRFTVEIYFFSGALREIPKRLEPVGLCHTLYVIISLFINLHGDNWAYSPSSPSFSANSYCWQWRYGVWFIRRGKVNFCGGLRALIF